MANVIVDIDTTKKSCVVTVDGKKVPDVNEVYVGCYGDYFEMNVTSVDHSMEDLRKVTRLSADEKGELINTIGVK